MVNSYTDIILIFLPTICYKYDHNMKYELKNKNNEWFCVLKL